MARKRPAICYCRQAAFDHTTRCGREVAAIPLGRISGFWDSVTCKKCIAKRGSV